MASSASITGASASDLLRSSTSGFSGVPLRTLGRQMLAMRTRDFSVVAKLKKVDKHEYPWPDNPDPNVKGGILSHLSSFKPLKEKPKTVTLDFEKPLSDLQKKIADVREMARETGLDFSEQILSLEANYQKALTDLYKHLTPIQRVSIARHPNRPTCLDHIFNITEKFVELHGDRAGYDDPAIVTGIGTIDGRRYMFIGHQKGRNTKENIQRNFGMPTPHGYRKALRLMEYADHHGFPIVTLIDTPGAYADMKSEELNQGEAIAHNLRSMFGLKVPVVSIVIGEGGSGGALAIGCGNKLLMLENAVFYVASPEACAAILWKSAKASPTAAEKLKITAHELVKLKVADGVIPEPVGGAHRDPNWTSQQIKVAINEAMGELTKMNTEELLRDRMLKFRKIGEFQEGIPQEPYRKRNMKKKEIPDVVKIPDAELEVEVEKLKQQILEAINSSSKPPKLDLDEMIRKLEREVAHEFSEAVEALGFTDRFSKLQEEVSAANNQLVDPLLMDKIDKLTVEFRQGLSAAPNFVKLQKKLGMLDESKVKVDKLKQQILEANNSSSKPPKLDLDEMIRKLEREVDHEYSEAVEALGFTDRFSKLQEEVSAGNNQLVDPLLKVKIEKLKVEFEQCLSAAPNFSKLQKKLGMLKELSKLKHLSETEKLKQEVREKIVEAINNPRIKENYEALTAEIQRVGASSSSDLDDELKKKIIEFDKEVDLQLVNALKSVGLDVQLVKLRGRVSNKSEVLDFVREIEELKKAVENEIEILASSFDVKSKVEELKLLVVEAGETPDHESKNRITSLIQQIKQGLTEAINSSIIKQKYDNLESKLSSKPEFTGELDGDLQNDKLLEEVGTNHTIS